MSNFFIEKMFQPFRLKGFLPFYLRLRPKFCCFSLSGYNSKVAWPERSEYLSPEQRSGDWSILNGSLKGWNNLSSKFPVKPNKKISSTTNFQNPIFRQPNGPSKNFKIFIALIFTSGTRSAGTPSKENLNDSFSNLNYRIFIQLKQKRREGI